MGGSFPLPPKGREKEEKRERIERNKEREREEASGGGERVFFCTAVQVISNINLLFKSTR